jgi:hypothetical protein
MSLPKNTLSCRAKILTTDGCKTYASTIKHSSCVGQDASLLFCDSQGNVSAAKARTGAELGCEDQFLVFDSNTHCLTRKSAGESFFECFPAPPISCDSLAPATSLLCTDEFAFCDGTTLMRAALGESSAIAEDSSFLVCQAGTLELAPVQPASGIPGDSAFLFAQGGLLFRAPLAATAPLFCDSEFVVAQNGQLVSAELGTSITVLAGDELLVCREGSLDRVLVVADSVACDARFLVTQNGELTLATVDPVNEIPCTAAFLYCDGTSIVSAPLGDGSCAQLGFTSSVLVCHEDQVLTKPFDYFSGSIVSGTAAIDSALAGSGNVRFEFTVTGIPIKEGHQYRVTASFPTQGLSADAYPVGFIDFESTPAAVANSVCLDSPFYSLYGAQLLPIDVFNQTAYTCTTLTFLVDGLSDPTCDRGTLVFSFCAARVQLGSQVLLEPWEGNEEFPYTIVIEEFATNIQTTSTSAPCNDIV